MNTEKLYDQDPFLQTFTARVVDCRSLKNAWSVVLDRTAFYPEGGGQPADHGLLGGIAVIDVQEEDGVVFHIVEKAVEIGETVTGQIDWARRFDHMQQHSGEHILSGILCADYRCDNVGFHIGAETVTIDYNVPLSWEQVLEAERKANEIVWANAPVEVSFPSEEALSTLHYRSKKALTGQVRIVTFPGADCCACCGTHVLRAGQAGPIKALSVQKFREGVRIEILCGRRALHALSRAYEQNRSVGQALSVKGENTAAAVERLKEELSAARLRQSRLEESLFAQLAEQYAGQGTVILLQEGLQPDGARKLADALAKRCGGLAAVFSETAPGTHLYALVHANGNDLTALVKAMNSTLRGRGGGRNGFAQGSVQASWPEIELFMKGAADSHA